MHARERLRRGVDGAELRSGMELSVELSVELRRWSGPAGNGLVRRSVKADMAGLCEL